MPVFTPDKSGNDNENFIILFLGDGYTENEQSKFTDFADKCAKTLILTPCAADEAEF